MRMALRTSLNVRLVLVGTAIGLAAIVNVALMIAGVRALLFAPAPADWVGFEAIAERVRQGLDPYADPAHAFRWSPLAAYALGPITDLGLPAWRLGSFLALLTLPRRILVLALATFPFWIDIALASNLTVSFVLAWHARTNAAAALGFAAVAFLVPRPLYVPMLAWLWLRRGRLRLPLLVLMAVAVAGAWATGWIEEWIAVLLTTNDSEMNNTNNLAPSAAIGLWWAFVAWPLAFLAFRRGWVGLASILASPYWLAYYWIFPLLDARHLAFRKAVGARVRAVRQRGSPRPQPREDSRPG